MFIIDNYPLAVIFCAITMLCWGSWANTQKLTESNWRFELFYWDYAFGILLFTVGLAFTLGSIGHQGRSFLSDISQADTANIYSALLGGAIFNAANILLVAAISIAGMSVAFPVGIGLALVIGVIVNYLDQPLGNPTILFGGVLLVALAIAMNAWAYKKLPSKKTSSAKGLLLSVLAGILMGFFYKFVAQSMVGDFAAPSQGKLTPYSALVFFAVGLVLSNFIFNSIVMYKPFAGLPLSFSDYFKGKSRNHFFGLLGGVIWCIGMSFSIIASGKAGTAISYGLGQGATIVAAIWGIYVWKEFKDAPKGTDTILKIMMGCYVIGLGLIIAAR